MPLPQDLTTTTESHIRDLLGEFEDIHLEFKRDLPSGMDKDKHEFLADVSAFANSSGGDLIFGLDQDSEGRATELVAQECNADKEKLRLLDILLNGIQPRIHGIQVQAIELASGFAVIVRVLQSWAGPHRVSTNQHFYIREGPRKRPLDVPEIRSLFLRTERQAEQVRSFRTERLGRLMSGAAPHPLVAGALLVGHFVPTQAALGQANVDPIQYMRDRYLPVLGTRIGGARVNLDGALVVRNPNPEGTHGYSQLFRNGYFETVQVLTRYDDKPGHLGGVEFERSFITLLEQLRVEYGHLGIATEMSCMVSLLNVYRMEFGPRDRWRYNLDNHQGVFDRSTLVLPDILLLPELAPSVALRPVFDLVWQSAGMEASYNYNPAGVWVPSQQ